MSDGAILLRRSDKALVVRRVERSIAIQRTGIRGAAGNGGGGGAPTAQRIAGEVLGGHRAVRVGSDGKAYYATPGDANPDATLGVTVGAAALGGSVDIQTSGELIEPSWAWTPGAVYLASSGILTQVIPTSGAIVRIGTVANATSIIIQPRLVARL